MFYYLDRDFDVVVVIVMWYMICDLVFVNMLWWFYGIMLLFFVFYFEVIVLCFYRWSLYRGYSKLYL